MSSNLEEKCTNVWKMGRYDLLKSHLKDCLLYSNTGVSETHYTLSWIMKCVAFTVHAQITINIIHCRVNQYKNTQTKNM